MGEMLSRYRTRLAAGLTADASQRGAAERLDQLCDTLAAWKPNMWPHGLFGGGGPPRGLYLWGAVGGGKSMLMDLFFESAPVAKKMRAHFHEFMLARHAFMHEARERRGGEQDDLIALAAKEVAESARLLCFDELQISDIADAMILGRLFEALFARGVVVVATGNRAPDDFYKDGLNRQLFLPFIAVFKDHLDIVELKAARDYRLERLLAAPVYYTPLNAAADRAMDEAWSRLTHGAAAHPLTLEVQGRPLHVPCAAAGCARFAFADLCAAFLGAADYLELAERFDTIFIDHIPALTADNKDAAARLRLLVDALYEAKTKLVCSAAAEPSALYPQGVQSFEFERTTSRLMEMRSRDYLSTRRRDREFMRAVRET
jgi:cell division protein ZapE